MPYASPDDIPGTNANLNYHQSTTQWTDDLAQEAEESQSLADVKPENIKNDVQPEVSNFFYPARNRALYQRV